MEITLSNISKSFGSNKVIEKFCFSFNKGIYAILGKNRTQEIYKFAIKHKMRFFSYGDACLIWNKNE